MDVAFHYLMQGCDTSWNGDCSGTGLPELIVIALLMTIGPICVWFDVFDHGNLICGERAEQLELPLFDNQEDNQ